MLSVQAADFRARLVSSIIKANACFVVTDCHKSNPACLSYEACKDLGVMGADAISLTQCLFA